MDKQELRLRLIEIVVGANNAFTSEPVMVAVKNYEAYIASGSEDKAQAPSDTVKEQRIGKTASSKKKPQRRIN